jgi:tRNA pseudouridine55 synthase
MIPANKQISAQMPDYFLNIYKPMGITAHDCIARLRRILRERRIGHAGTLDPLAVGVLPVAVGQYTRLLNYLAGDKSYRAQFTFGLVTDTDDITGQVIKRCPVPDLDLQPVQNLLPQFTGTIWQKPPAFSAVHLHGKRLYELARSQGVSWEQIPARPVTVHRIQVIGWQAGNYPELDVQIDCGSGTYIRAIARDLGAMLGCGATLSALQRTASNGFYIQDSLALSQVELLQQQTFAIKPQQVLAHLPSVILSDSELHKWQRGQNLPLPQDCSWKPSQAIATYKDAGDDSPELVGISLAGEHYLRPKVVLQSD